MKKFCLPMGLTILGLSAAAIVSAAGPDSALARIAEAEAAQHEAAALGYEWRDTAQLIAAAKAALERGETEESERLAGAALLQGRQAIAQAKFMEQNWQTMIPKPLAVGN